MMRAQLVSNVIKSTVSMLTGILCLLISSLVNIAIADGSMQVKSVNVSNIDRAVEIKINGENIGASTVYELPNPERIIVDFANAALSNNFTSQINADGITLQTKHLADSKPTILRFEFYLPEKIDFETRKNDNEIRVLLKRGGGATSQSPAASTPSDTMGVYSERAGSGKGGGDSKGQRTGDKIGSVIGAAKNIESQLPEINPLDSRVSPKTKAQQMEDAFNFSGYNKERITVEFQKMDLHNVFNFLRQVSGVNIVVDESVQGSLTLVLDDVPWDFALDIILNLKDLEKEERFNTLVIYPKKKEFKWPDKSQDNLSFQADAKVVERESLTIKQQAGQSFEHPEARQEINKGKEAEKNENYELAVSFYERAYEKWPSNSNLSNKIASIYLVYLKQYAKSLYYSNLSLKHDKNNSRSLVLAAISSANMQDNEKAIGYFDKCTKVKTPLKEALLSYSSFCEDTHDYNCAISNLERYNLFYGEDMDSLVNAARVYDKMGQGHKAVEKYNKLLISGYRIPPDLEKYVRSRVTVN